MEGDKVDERASSAGRRELVAAVGSRVMGWRVFDINDMRDDEWRDSRANYPYLEQYVGTALYTNRAEFRLWNPDTDIAAAMEVVEQMRNENWRVKIRDWGQTNLTWDVTFYNGNYSCGLPADTLPESICRSALGAIELNSARAVLEIN